MKRPFTHGFRWTALSETPAAAEDFSSQRDLVYENDRGPINATDTFESLGHASKVQSLSPKRVEDNVAERLQADGWRFGASVAAITTGVIATINFIMSVVFLNVDNSSSGSSTSKMLTELFHGSCEKAATLNTWTHLAINVISACLLAGSNFTMQVLIAPTRRDIDRAHAKERWLDIGLPSMRNLGHIGRRRSCLWWVLALTSLPLHLLFNSAFFSAIGDNAYNVVFANPGFLEGDTFNYTGPQRTNLEVLADRAKRIQDQYLQSKSAFTLLDNQECINAYANDMITDRRSVIVITDQEPTSSDNGSVLLVMEASPASTISRGHYQWLCPIPIDLRADGVGYTTVGTVGTYDYSISPLCHQQVSDQQVRGEGWRPSNITAQYCLSEEIPGECSFHANVVVLWVVFACNLTKLLVMIYVLFSPVITKPLMTIGDAISSFIIDPDPATEQLGATNIRQVKQLDKSSQQKSRHPPRGMLKSMFGQGGCRRPAPRSSSKWGAPPSQQSLPSENGSRLIMAASKTRWTFVAAYFVVCTTIIGVLLHIVVSRMDGSTSFSALYSRGFGKVSPDLVITGWEIETMSADGGVVSSVLVANSPQLLLSFFYVAVNALLTLMSSSREWSRFSLSWALRRGPRSLRTSSPRGSQRRTYFLQLPFRFAIPLIAVSALLHWLISQSIFLAVVSDYDTEGRKFQPFAIASCGYSPIAMIFLIMVSIVLMLGLGVLSLVRMEPGMPIVASCSAAISSCCHVNWKADSSEGLDEIKMGQNAREEMVKSTLVWGEIVGDNERLAYGQASKERADGRRRYGFVSAMGADWQERVR